jgi:hypothetical protein
LGLAACFTGFNMGAVFIVPRVGKISGREPTGNEAIGERRKKEPDSETLHVETADSPTPSRRYSSPNRHPLPMASSDPREIPMHNPNSWISEQTLLQTP